MELSQRFEIPLAAEQVWQSLNDPAILKQCLPGCEVFEPISETEFNITMLAKVGPVKARFKGEIKLTELNPPISYTLSGVGKGGVAGFIKGSAKVLLEEKKGEAVTLMTYSVKANVGGKLAQLGTRLVAGATRKMANEFFTNFVRLICDDPDGTLEIKLETVEEV